MTSAELNKKERSMINDSIKLTRKIYDENYDIMEEIGQKLGVWKNEPVSSFENLKNLLYFRL